MTNQAKCSNIQSWAPDIATYTSSEASEASYRAVCAPELSRTGSFGKQTACLAPRSSHNRKMSNTAATTSRHHRHLPQSLCSPLATSRSCSKLLIQQHPSSDLPEIKRRRLRQKGRQKFRKHLQDGSAAVIPTDFDLTAFFDTSYQLPRTDQVPASIDGFQHISFGPHRILHLVDRNGLHYASVIKKPDSPHFHESYEHFQRLQARLPKGAGAPVEAVRGKFRTWHLMLSGQDTACMEGPYWNAKFMKHEGSMRAFLQDEHVRRLQGYCNRQLFECFPDHAAAYQRIQQSDHYFPFNGFLWGPCFPSLAINQEGNAYSLPHRDRRDYLQGLAAVLSYGDYTELTINFAEAKVSIDFPPGALCIFPSHVLHHFNSPILDGETRGSMTMFMSSDVVKWAGYGGKACDTPEDMKQAYRQQCLEAWALFKTVEEKARMHVT